MQRARFRPRLGIAAAAFLCLAIYTFEKRYPDFRMASDYASTLLAVAAALLALHQFWHDAKIERDLDALTCADPPPSMHGIKKDVWARSVGARRAELHQRRYEVVFYVVLLVVTGELVALL